ncbi:unnamed protein product, partial [Rotaria socialis]
MRNIIGKDEESSLEPIISKNVDSKSSLNILVDSIKCAHGIPVEDGNWLNLAKPDTPK